MTNPLLLPKETMTKFGVKVKAKIDYLDDIAEVIHLDVTLCLHYRDANALQYVTGVQGFVSCDPETSDIYIPTIQFLQTRSCEHIEGFKLLVSTYTGEVYLYRVYRLALREVFELQRFPFDRQVIKCRFQTYGGKFCQWSSPEHDTPYGVRGDDLWRRSDCLAEYDQTIWIIDWVSGDIFSEENPSSYRLSFGLSRTSTYYLTNFVLVSYFLVFSSLSCLAVDHKDFGNRASITFTLLLTTVALKFVMSSSIPRINYLTLFDFYNILSMLMIMAVILENFVVAFYDSDEIASQIDIIFASVFLVSWSLFHLFILIGAAGGLFYLDWELVMREDESSVHYQRVFHGAETFEYLKRES